MTVYLIILHSKFANTEIVDKLTPGFDGAIVVVLRCFKIKIVGDIYVHFFVFIASDGAVGRCEKPTIIFMFTKIISLAVKVICASVKA